MAAASSSTPSIVQLTAPTHFPIKLTSSNFLVWRLQLHSTLIGLNLLEYIDGSLTPPSQFLDSANQSDNQRLNPAYTLWYRQDQILISAILGSCSDAIQPLISSAASSQEAWERLLHSYANSSRSRIISLKAKLAQNPKGTRPVADFLHEMRSIADELALTQHPISEEDLTVHIITQLGDEYSTIVAAIKIRESPISFSELFDKLTDFERTLKDKDSASMPPLATANFAQRQNSRSHHSNSLSQDFSSNFNSRRSRGGYGGNSSRSNRNAQRSYRPDLFCRFCEIAGHDTRDCRKLAKFLKENNISVHSPKPSPPPSNPVVNSTNSLNSPVGSQQPWLFDSGASHHATSNLSALQTYSDYGGPDEIFLGDGTGLSISHTGHTQIHTPSKSLSLSNVLCVPHLQKNLISIAKLCKTNLVSVEFFSFFIFTFSIEPCCLVFTS